MTIRLEEMRIKRRDSEQWMHHHLLPPELRERVRCYYQYKWLETHGVDEKSLVQSEGILGETSRGTIVWLWLGGFLYLSMDERLLYAICERLKPCLFTESTCIVQEGDPVNEMLFILHGQHESVTTDGRRSEFFNCSFLKGDFCGEKF